MEKIIFCMPGYWGFLQIEYIRTIKETVRKMIVQFFNLEIKNFEKKKLTASLKMHLQKNIFCHFKFYYNRIIGICRFYRRQQKCNLFSDLTFGSILVKAHPLCLIDTFGCLSLVVKADRTEVTYYEFQERKRIQISVVYSVETVVLFFDFTLAIKERILSSWNHLFMFLHASTVPCCMIFYHECQLTYQNVKQSCRPEISET